MAANKFEAKVYGNIKKNFVKESLVSVIREKQEKKIL
jgi:hypothetical protein